MALNFRPDEDLAERLRTQAASERTSVQSLLVKAAEEYLSRHAKARQIDEALDLIMQRSGNALRRLGDGPQ